MWSGILVCGVVVCARVAAEEKGLVARQMIIRAPEIQVVEAALANPDDVALARIVRGWVDVGRAKVLSDLSVTLETKVAHRSAMWGKWEERALWSWQDKENGKVGLGKRTPFLIGSSFETSMAAPKVLREDTVVQGLWSGRIVPADMETVRWPVWSPEMKETKANSVDWKDWYEEGVLTMMGSFPVGVDKVMGIMRRADDTEPDPLRVQLVDMILVRVTEEGKPGASAGSGFPAEEKANDAAAPVPVPALAPAKAPGRLTVMAFGMKDHEAVELLGQGVKLGDAGLWEELLKRKAARKVTLRSFIAGHTPVPVEGHAARTMVHSGRQYSYPSDMPTLPKEWSTREVGTILDLQMEGPRLVSIEYEHHPAAPRKVERRCALDSAELVLRQLQPHVRGLRAIVPFDESGVALLGAMRTPDCNGGMKGLTMGETLVLMGKLDAPPPIKLLPEPKAIAPEATPKPVVNPGAGVVDDFSSLSMQVETVIFDVPVAEKIAWETPTDGLTDTARFAELLDRVKQGKDAKIAAHVAAMTYAGGQFQLWSVEEARTVTEAVASQEKAPGRYRPSVLKDLMVGTVWKGDAVVQRSEDKLDEGTPEIQLMYELSHDVAPPKEPDFKEMIAAALKSEGRELPDVEEFEEKWEGEVRVKAGNARFIGFKLPPGEAMKGRMHLVFVRGRWVGKGPGRE